MLSDGILHLAFGLRKKKIQNPDYIINETIINELALHINVFINELQNHVTGWEVPEEYKDFVNAEPREINEILNAALVTQINHSKRNLLKKLIMNHVHL